MAAGGKGTNEATVDSNQMERILLPIRYSLSKAVSLDAVSGGDPVLGSGASERCGMLFLRVGGSTRSTQPFRTKHYQRRRKTKEKQDELDEE